MAKGFKYKLYILILCLILNELKLNKKWTRNELEPEIEPEPELETELDPELGLN